MIQMTGPYMGTQHRAISKSNKIYKQQLRRRVMLYNQELTCYMIVYCADQCQYQREDHARCEVTAEELPTDHEAQDD